MNSAFIKIGLSSCDMGVSYFLPRLVGVTIASEMMMTGRFVNAERALAVGLANQVVADEALNEAAQVFVDEMMATSPMGLRMTKEGLNMAIDAGSLEAAMHVIAGTANDLLIALDINNAIGVAGLPDP